MKNKTKIIPLTLKSKDDYVVIMGIKDIILDLEVNVPLKTVLEIFIRNKYFREDIKIHTVHAF